MLRRFQTKMMLMTDCTGQSHSNNMRILIHKSSVRTPTVARQGLQVNKRRCCEPYTHTYNCFARHCALHNITSWWNMDEFFFDPQSLSVAVPI